MKLKTLSVRLYGLPIGTLQQTNEGKLRFEYLEDTGHALSMSLPRDRQRYGNMPCETYFGGLLPESADARKAIARMFDANPNNTFSLLAAIGYVHETWRDL
jgi:serine/threonine-protein kinase HipA